MQTRSKAVYECALAFLFLVSLSLLLTGCDSDDDDDDELAISELKLVNAIPDAPTLIPIVDEDRLNNASFGQVGANYTADEGVIVEFGVLYNDSDDVQNVLIDEFELEIASERDIHAIAWGTFASPQLTLLDNPQLEFEEDEDGNLIARDDLEVQVFNASSLDQALDIYLDEFDTPLQIADLVSTLTPGQSSGQLNLIGDDDYRIRITETADEEVIYDSREFSLPAGRNVLLLVLDYFGPGDQEIRVVSISAGSATTLVNEDLPSDLRLMNFVPEIGAVDLYFGDTNQAPLFSGVEFQEKSEYISFDADDYSVNLTPEGESTNFVFEQEISLIAGESRTLIVAGSPSSDDGTAAQLVVDDLRPVATEIQLKFVNAAQDAEGVDFYVLSPGEPLSDAIPESSNVTFLANVSLPLAIGTHDILVTRNREATVLAGPTRISVEAGIVTMVLSDSPNGGPPFQLVLIEENN